MSVRPTANHTRARNRDHRRASASTTAAAKAGDTEAGSRTRVLPANSISITGMRGGAHYCPGFCSGLGSLESEASLRVRRTQRRRSGRRGCVLVQAERAKEAEFEAGEEQRRAVLERAGRGVMQDAQQQKRDQRDIDLDADGVFVAAEKAADLEVLLEPLEQQLNLPALFVKLCDVGGGGARSRW